MKKQNITEKQSQLLGFIAEFKHQYKRYPTMQEMADNTGTTVAAVYNKLESINRKKIIWK